MTTSTPTRNAALTDLMTVLADQNARRADFIAPASALRMKDGQLIVTGVEQQTTDAVITEDGVTPPQTVSVDGTYAVSDVFNEGVSRKLDVPGGYLNRLHRDAVDVYDANVNGLLHGKKVRTADGVRVDRAGDKRKFLVRSFTGTEGTPGYARAFLSNSYGVLDNWDFALAILSGIRETGLEVDTDNFSTDITDRRMQIRVTVPGVQILAPELLNGYRSPFSGQTGNDIPVVWAGLHFGNSEVGCGAWTVTPRIVFQVCTNGMTITKDAIRGVHLGAKQEAGIIDWSARTQGLELATITSKVTDAVSTFLTPGYLQSVVDSISEAAAVELGDAPATVTHVTKALKYSQAEADGILGSFVKGGQMTAGGVLQAITAWAQDPSVSADRAEELEGSAIQALNVAAAFARR